MAASSLSNFLSLLSLNSNPKTNSLPNLSLPSRKANNVDLSPLVASNDVVSVVYPAVANANALFFKSAYNVQVIVDEKEHEEQLISRFRKKVLIAGVIQEAKRRRFFENPREVAKRKARDAAKRNRRPRYIKSKNTYQDKQEDIRNKRDEDDEDNWEFTDDDELPAHDYLVRLNQTNNRWDNDEKGSSSNPHFVTPAFPLREKDKRKKWKKN